MTEATALLQRVILHQLSILDVDPPPWDVEELAALAMAYDNCVVCLSGGDVLALPPDLDRLSEAAARAILEHTDHYATFLVLFSRACMVQGRTWRASRIFALNKMLHGLNVWVTVEMPSIFRLAHCVGTVIGRARLGERLFVGHGCTIGASTDEAYPTLGHGVSLRTHSAILGRCVIGDHVAISAGVILINTDVPSNSLVVSRDGNPQIIPSDFAERFTQKVFGSRSAG